MPPIDLSRLDDPRAFLDEVARHHFPSFLMMAFQHISGGASLVPNWHLDALAHQLDMVSQGHTRRLLVTMPPRHLKSVATSVAWVAWRLGQDPRLNFVCVSYSKELAEKHARDCRAIMQSTWYRRLFPRTIIQSTRTAAADFNTTMNGGRLATSIDGTLTGRGGDIIIIDDPIKPEDAMSEVIRGKVNDWFFTTLDSRLNDKRTGAIITVMQRLHQYDLAGMLRETGEWTELCLPSIATERSIIPLTRGRLYTRQENEALHPARADVADLHRVKASIGSVIFEAQYQQRPVPAEGNFVKADWLKTFGEAPTIETGGGQIVQSWDTATKQGLHNDWTVCVTALVRRKEIFILDVLRRRLTFPELQATAIAHARAHQASVLLIEDAASGTQLIQALRSEQAVSVPSPIALRPETDKTTRLAGVSPMIEAGQLILPMQAGWLAEFLSELLAFPSARFDDQVDALSQLLGWVRRNEQMRTTPMGEPLVISPSDFPTFAPTPAELEWMDAESPPFSDRW